MLNIFIFPIFCGFGLLTTFHFDPLVVDGTSLCSIIKTSPSPSSTHQAEYHIAMGPKGKKSLILLLAPILKGNATKSQLSLISEIYSKVSSHTDLDNLIEADYLAKIAWKHFHPDVTNSHIELILALVYYDLTIRRSSHSWKTVSEDRSKLDALLQRILQTTMTTTLDIQDSCLEYLTFLFLSCILRHDHGALTNQKVFMKWLDQILKSYTNRFLEEDYLAENVKTACALVYFLGVASVEKIDPIMEEVNSRCFLSAFVNCEDPQLRCLILEQRPSPSMAEFTKLQQKAKDLGIESLAFCILPYDLELAELQETLTDLDEQTLKKLASNLYSGSLSNREFLADTVIQNCIPQLRTNNRINETCLFDIFNHPPSLAILVPSYFDESDYLARYRYETCSKVNQHLVQCLQRLNILKEGIQGASKYYTDIEKVEGTGHDIQIHLKSKRNDIKQGNHIVLVQIGEPNKLNECSRLSKFGISSCELAEVTESGLKALRVNVRNELCSYTGILSLPSHYNAALLPLLQDKSILQSLAKTDAEVVAPPSKKRRVENGNTNQKGNTNQNDNTSAALKNIIDSTVSFTRGLPHSGRCTLINSFLEKVVKETPETSSSERTLIVLPSSIHVGSFRIDDSLLHLCYRAGDVESIKRTVDSLIKDANLVAEHLQLQEFDFGSSLKNALALYELHVEPRWNEFLKLLKINKNAVSKYPFAKLEVGEGDDGWRKALDQVVAHYAAIKRTFSQIQRLLLLDKADLTDFPEEADRAVSTAFPIVVSSPESLHLVGSDFDNVMSFVGAETGVVLSSKTKRVAFFGTKPPVQIVSEASLTERPSVRPEIATLIGEQGGNPISKYNPGLKLTCQWVKVPSADKQVNVEEARYLVSLYQYMRLLGYRNQDISLVVTSPYMKLLAEEILEELGIKKGSAPIDLPDVFEFGWPLLQLASLPLVASKYVLFSTHGALSFKDIKAAVASASLGFYVFGSQSLPFQIQSGGLLVYTGANVTAGTDDREKSHKAHPIDDAQHMADYVAEMLVIPRKIKA